MDSILTSIKKPLGIAEDYEHFDQDIIMHINSVFISNLLQMGIGPPNGFMITGKQEVWSEFTEDPIIAESVKQYIYLKVRLAFDPPTNSSHIASIERQIAELEWRLTNASEISPREVVDDGEA